MKKKDWYENWFSSAYYNLLYEKRDDFEAAELIDALLTHLQPMPGSRMLDIACGEGRFAKKLAEHDYNVTGIDLSHASIQNAKQYEADNLHFYVHDMRLPFYINYFDYAFNFFTSFGYFGTERDHNMAVASFAKSLKKGGLLVLDYLNTQYVIDNLVEKEVVNKNNFEFNITRSISDGYIVKDIQFTDELDTPYHFAERVAAFSLSDFVRMFKKAGLKLVGTFGNYSLEEYNPISSQRLIMIFKKQ